MKYIYEESRINKQLKGFIEVLDQRGYYVYININSIKYYRKNIEDRFLIITDEETYCLTEEEFYKVLSKMNTIEKLEGF